MFNKEWLSPLNRQNNMKQSEQNAAKLRETAEALSRDPKLIDLCRHASRDRGLRARILRDPIELLRSREMDIRRSLR